MTDQHTEDMDAVILTQMRVDFLDEAEEHIDRLNLLLTNLEKDSGSKALIHEIFRIAHTLKGSASFVGLTEIRDVAHKMEDVFGAVREDKLVVTASIIDTMFKGFDILKRLKANVTQDTPDDVDVSGIVADLTAILHADDKDAPRPPEKPDEITSPMSHSTASNRETDRRSSPAKHPSQTVRVRTNRLDSLMNLIGELIIARNRLNAYADGIKNDELEAVTSAIDRLTGHLQRAITGIRMVPIEWLFNKFPGIVRNLARDGNKQVELALAGKQTELDKNVIDRMYDPLMHLIRNAVDHGIEFPEERKKAGKDATGRIQLTARHEQNHIVIEMSDDGRGIQLEQIVKSAVEKKILTEKDAADLTENGRLNLIFSPGFSTSKTVSDVSGRGVGMDVVKTELQKLRGTVAIDTVPGKGTTFIIRLPLTLAVLQVLLVKTSGRIWGIPLNTVLETLFIPVADIQTIEKKEVIFIRDTPHSLKRLETILNLNTQNETENQDRPADKEDKGRPIVVVDVPGKKVALCVDDLMGKQDVVMKPLGEFTGHVVGIEGATILADGTITPIINVETLLNLKKKEVHHDDEC